jgi:sugar lactone lactonase YvrE
MKKVMFLFRNRKGTRISGMLCLMFLSIWVGMTGCSRQATPSVSHENIVIFPPPPAPTRIQYLTFISSSTDLATKQGRFRRYLFGEEEPRSIIKPYGIKVHGDKVYICDTGLAGLVVLDLSTGSLETWVPGGKGQLQLPVNCDVDKGGTLYVADASRQQVVIFDRERKYLHAIGEAEQFKPTDVAVRGDTLWVASVQDHAIHLYSTVTYNFLGELNGGQPGDPGFIRQPTNIALGEQTLFVSDFGDFNVKKFRITGTFSGTVGSYGNGPGQFTRPKGVALDRDGNLYVVDAAFQNVQIFNREGQMLMHFGGSYEGPGAMWLPAAVEISYENLSYFKPYVDESFELKYLIYVTNQYGPAKVNVYGFVEERRDSPEP